MVDDRARRRAQMRDKLAELKSAALAKLERRGYDVRGKTLLKFDRYLSDVPRSRNQNRYQTSRCRNLDGLTVWHEARLEEEDIENIPHSLWFDSLSCATTPADLLRRPQHGHTCGHADADGDA